jgi:hypothetical protein
MDFSQHMKTRKQGDVDDEEKEEKEGAQGTIRI